MSSCGARRLRASRLASGHDDSPGSGNTRRTPPRMRSVVELAGARCPGCSGQASRQPKRAASSAPTSRATSSIRHAAAGASRAERGHAVPPNAAGHDEVEVRQVGVDVEREPVRGDPVVRPHADRAHLVAADPHPGVLGVPLPHEAVVARGTRSPRPRACAGSDPRRGPCCLEIHDPVAHQLPRPVVRHVAAARRLPHLDAACREHALRRQQVALRALARPSVITGGCSRNRNVSGIASRRRSSTSRCCSRAASM